MENPPLFARSLLAAALLVSACEFNLEPTALASTQCGGRPPPSSGVVDFMPDSEIPSPCGGTILDEWAKWLTEHSDGRIVLEGHTGETPNGESSLRVSRHLADMVRERLIEMGVEPERILVVGYGDDLPLPPVDAPVLTGSYDRVYVTLARPNSDNTLQY